MKLYKTPLFLLLFCLLTLTMLSGCSSGPQAAGQSIDSPEASSPEQSEGEVQPEEDREKSSQRKIRHRRKSSIQKRMMRAEKGLFQRCRNRPALLPCRRMNLSSRETRRHQIWNRPRRSRKHPAGLRSRRNRRLEIRQWTIPGVRRRSLR